MRKAQPADTPATDALRATADGGACSLRERLAQHLGQRAIKALTRELADSGEETVMALLHDPDKRTADNTAWVCTHFDAEARKALLPHRDAFTDEVMRCESVSKRRLLLAVLDRLPPAPDLRTDYLDFCLQGILSPAQPHGVRALCIKQAYRQCRAVSELLQELRLTLEMLVAEPLPPSLRSLARRLLQQIPRQPLNDAR